MTDEGGGKDRDEHGRLGEECDQHLSARAEIPEGCADIHGGECHEHPGQREEADQRDSVRGRGKRQVRGQHRYDPAREPHGAKEDVRRTAEEERGVVGNHRFLDKQLAQVPVRLQDTGRTAVLEPGPPVIDPAQEHRGSQDYQERLEEL